MKAIPLFLLGLTISFHAMSQISGPTTVAAGSTQTYSYTATVVVTPSWQISNGTRVSQTSSYMNYSVTVLWSSSAASGGLALFDGSIFKASNTVTIVAPPAAPTASAASSISNSSFTANWSFISGATSYSLDVSTSSSFASFVTGYNALSVSSTSQNVTGLSANTTYYYRVRAASSGGTSSNSNTITALTAPPIPTATAASGLTNVSFVANWGSVTGATSYLLDVSTVSTFSSFVTGYNGLSVNGTSQAVSNLSPNSNYYFRVRSTNGSGISGSSNSISVLTLLSAPTPAGTSSITATSFVANWLAVTGSTGYQLDVSVVNDFSSFVSGYNSLSVASSSTSATVSGLSTTATQYYYRVRALNAAGASANSYTVTVAPLPGLATATSATSVTTSTFTANWTAGNYATGYQLDVSTASDFSNYVVGYNGMAIGNITTQSVTGLAANTTYFYRVRSVNSSGVSANSNFVSVITVPLAPTANPCSSIAENSFVANWSSGSFQYQLDVSIANDFSSFVPGYNNLLLTNSATSASVTGLTGGTTYYYRLRAVNASGVSTNSNTVTVLTLPPIPVATPGTSMTANSFVANWLSTTSATGYHLDVSLASNFSSFVIGYNSLSVASLSQNVTGLSEGTTYYYRIRAANASGVSANSNIIALSTIPSVPAATAATAITATTFTANWSAATGATSYQLDVSTVSTFASFVGIYNNLSVVGTSQVVGGLSGGTTYYYRVRGVNSSGASASGSTGSALTLPVAPSGLSSSAITATGFTANWASTLSATSYRLDVSNSSTFATFVGAYNNLTVATTSQGVTGLTANTQYYFRVRAVNGSGASANSADGSVLTLIATPIIAASTLVTTSSFTANWGATAGAASYQLDVSTVSTFASFVTGYNSLAVATASRSITGLAAGTTYYFRVRGINGAAVSPNSATASTPTLTLAPAAAAATAIAETSFNANWVAVSGATSYALDVSLSSLFSTFVSGFNSLSVTGTFKAVTGLAGGTTYYYRVRGVNVSGASASGTTATSLTLPPLPSGLNATTVLPTAFTANWAATASATTYLLYVATDAAITNFLSGYNGLSLTNTNRTITGLTPSTPYFWRVRALNASGSSGNSATQTTTTLTQFANQNENFIVAHDALVEGIVPGIALDALPRQSVSQTVQYFDGLGRPKQTVSTQSSPTRQDVVQPMAYDQYGRETIKYLPYTSGSDGWLKTNFLPKENVNYATAASPQFQFYQSAPTAKVAIDTRPFSETIFEPSPLNRPLNNIGPGAAWYTSSSVHKSVGHGYLVNADGTAAGQERIISWTISSVVLGGQTVNLLSPTLSYYASNSLSIKTTTDEQNHTVREYVDKQGKTILKKVQVANTPATQTDADWALTYYIYDDFDRLRFVLPPEFNTKTAAYTAGTDHQVRSDMLRDWAFQYQYDERGRMIIKQVPGAASVEMVYDQWDRLVLSRDGNQLAASKWSFTKYDVLNRPIITGEISSANTRAQMVTAVNAITNRNEVTTTGSVGYTLNQTYPTTATITDVYAITFYDNYATFKTNLSLGTAYDFVAVSGYTSVANDRVRGLSTASKVRILGTINFLITVNYYDDRYRVIQTIGDDHLGNKNRTTNAYYGITGWVTKSLLQHGTAVLTTLTETDYDHQGRPTKTYITLDGGTRVITSQMQYNELGQLVDKKLHSTDNGANYLQSVDYRYNIRGWLSSINNGQLTVDDKNDETNDLFGMELNYEQAVAINGINTTAQYNGNISSINWSTNNLMDAAKQKIYGYKYDNLNRLTLAGYATKNAGLWNADVDMFNEALTYDKNGNILSLSRTSLFAGVKTTIDQLGYNYAKGNQLNYVDDASTTYWSKNDNNPDYGYAEEFNQIGAVTKQAEYTYDANGNMKADLNKGITGITYNYLNKPTAVTLTAGTINYLYDAVGTKLKKTAGASSSDYVGPIQYENTKLAFIMLPDGRATKNASGWTYEYFHKDHLGNTRVVFGLENLVDEYKATMETPRASMEENTSYFRNVAASRLASSNTALNRTPKSSLTPNPDRSAETNGFGNRPIGPAKMLQVQEGDTINISAHAKYTAGTAGVTTVISNLVAMVAGAFGISSGEAAHTAFTANLSGLAGGITANTNVPKAYLCYILYNSTYTSPQFGYKLVSSAALNNFEKLGLNITVPAAYNNGYLYTYVINESNVSSASSVYFDDVYVRHWRTAKALQVAQVNEYYPFGLAINPLSYDKNNAFKNDYLYNGKELQDDFGLGWLDYGARMFMSEIGRWGVLDGKAEYYLGTSPYVYALNQPTNAIDPDGNVVIFVNGNHFGLSEPGQSYWRGTEYVKVRETYSGQRYGEAIYRSVYEARTVSFDSEVKNKLGDQSALYYDGSGGGWHPMRGGRSASAIGRISLGYDAGARDAAEIVANLARDKNGNIVETIKIITHSMGSAYGQGFVGALKDYITTLPVEQQKQILISLVADFDPYQAGDLVADSDIKTMQFNHKNFWNVLGFGWLGGNEDQKGDVDFTATNTGTSTDHDIITFFNDISSLSEGTYKLVNNKWVKQ
jgi:RHS repeat-associated protein